jgi:hypothetical protein
VTQQKEQRLELRPAGFLDHALNTVQNESERGKRLLYAERAKHCVSLLS